MTGLTNRVNVRHFDAGALIKYCCCVFIFGREKKLPRDYTSCPGSPHRLFAYVRGFELELEALSGFWLLSVLSWVPLRVLRTFVNSFIWGLWILGVGLRHIYFCACLPYGERIASTHVGHDPFPGDLRLHIFVPVIWY